MTVEEIEIIVTAKVTEVLKEFMKILPAVKQTIKQVQDVFNTIDTSAIEKSMKKLLSSYSKTMKKVAKDNEIKIKVTNDDANKAIDETEKKLDSLKKKTTASEGWKGFNSSEEAGDISGIKINGLDSNEHTKEINKIKEDIQEISETEIKPKIQQDISGNIKNKNSISEETSKVDIKPTQESISVWDILKAKIEQIKPAIEQIKAKIKGLKQTKVLSIGNLDVNFKPLINQIDRARAPLDNFKDGIKRAKAEGKSLSGIFLSKVGGAISKLPNLMKGFIASIRNAKSQTRGLSNVSVKIKNSFSSMTKGLRGGFSQILKYAGALLSIQGIYSTLRGCANSWLSSQNAGAKQLSANIEYMKYAMGSALAPVIQFVTNLVYQLMKAIQSVAYALTGVNIFAKASASSMGNVASNAKKAKNETKQLAGVHDEINNISDNDSGSGTGGSGTTAPDFDLSNIDLDSNLIDMIKNGDWYQIGATIAEKINESLASIPWEKIQNTAKNIATNIGNFINGFVDKLDWNLVGSTIGNGINTALMFADTLLTTIKWDKIGTSIANMLNSAIKTTKWDLIGKTIADAINGAIDLAYGFVTTFDWKKFGTSIGESIDKLFKNIDWLKVGETLGEGIKGVFNGISETLQEIDWQSIGDDIADCIMSIDWGGVVSAIFTALGSALALKPALLVGFFSNLAYNLSLGLQNIMDQIEALGLNIFEGILYGILYAIGGIGQWIVDHIFKPFIDGFKNVFGIHSPSTVMQEMGGYIIDGLKNGIKGIWEKIKSIFENLKTNIGNKFKEIVSKIKEKFSISSIKSHFSNVVSGIKNAFTSIPTWFKNKFSDAWTKVKNVFSKGGKVFSGIKDGILSALKKVINGLIDGINKVIKVPFDGINKALNKIKNISIVGKKPFSGLPTISTPQIPKLAKGNVAYDETLAIFGEYSGAKSNPEITAPQSVLRDTFEDVLAGHNENSGQPLHVTIQYLGKTIFDDTIDYINAKTRRTGKNTIVTVGD